MEFEKFYVVFLQTGDAEEPEETVLHEIRKAHLAHNTNLHYEHGAIAGPMGGDRRDFQGITLLPQRELSFDAAKQLAESDPAVKAGLLKVWVVEWSVVKGLLELHQLPQKDEK